jgi:hypothetical protein
VDRQKKNQQKYDPIPQKFSWRKKGLPSKNVGHLSELDDAEQSRRVQHRKT